MQTREKGIVTEAKILAALAAAGYLVLIPFGDGHKYDFVIDDTVSLRRVQCKTGRIKNGVLFFNSYSQSGNGQTKQGYYGLADLFAVLHPDSGEVYLVPVEKFGMAGVSLRLVPTLNGQVHKINWAADYLLTTATPVDNERE
ncbi:MAG TPA: group I intron-associated PD-(D/E)XK endonuclease [Pyrinomonadaceae bacterium]